MQLTFDEMMQHVDTKPEFRAKVEYVNGVDVTIFSYMVSMTDTFNCDLSKEFRGTTFRNDTKECICRPLVKFFNVGEKEETQPHLVNWDNAVFYTKHDGSMLTPCLINDEIVWKTKNTFYSDVAIAATNYYKRTASETHQEAIKEMLNYCTPIFEYVGPHNQIVLPYENEDMILIGTRDIATGVYTPNAELAVSDVTYEDVYNMENVEGFVIWDGNQLVKAKSAWYMERHKICSDFNVKSIINATLDNTVDDMLATIAQLGLMLRYYQVGALRDKVVRAKLNTEDMIDIYWNIVKDSNSADRKAYAMLINQSVPKEYRSIMFKMLDNKDTTELVNKLVFEDVYSEYKEVIE